MTDRMPTTTPIGAACRIVPPVRRSAERVRASRARPTCTGTLTTTVWGRRYSRRAFRASADWLCSHWLLILVTPSG